MLTNLFYYDYMKTIRTGLLKDLYDKMTAISDSRKNAENAYISLEKCSFVDLDLTNSELFGDALGLIQTAVGARTHALLLEKIVFDFIFGRVLCAFRPEIMQQRYISSNSLAGDIATVFYNPQLDKDLQKTLSFFLQSFILEFGLVDKALERVSFELGQLTFGAWTWSSTSRHRRILS